MIVLDANFFLRYLSRPRTPNDLAMHERTRAFFRLVRAGSESFTTSDAVIAEVVWTLHHPRHYGSARSDVAARLKPVLTLSGCKIPRKRCILEALDLWATTTTISFVDALVIAQGRDLKVRLGSFDAAVGRVPGVVLWQAPAPPPGETGTTNGATGA